MLFAKQELDKVTVIEFGSKWGRRSKKVSIEVANTFHTKKKNLAYWKDDITLVVDYVTRGKRREIYIRDKHTCLYCGKFATKVQELTIDHVIPKVKGGTNELSNFVTACSLCNSWKGDKDVEYFLTTVEFFRRLDFRCYYCRRKIDYRNLTIGSDRDGESIACCTECEKRVVIGMRNWEYKQEEKRRKLLNRLY